MLTGVFTKRVRTTLLILVLAECSWAQYSETLNTDRPGQAFTPYTVGKGLFQAEMGGGYFGSRDRGNDFRANSLGLTGFFKHGLSEAFELNYGFTVLNQRLRSTSDEDSDTGVQGMNVGARFNIKSGENRKASYGFLFSLFLNNYSHPAFRTDNVAPLFLFIYSQSISEVVSLNTNLGMSWNGDDPKPQTNYVINLGFSLTPRMSAFVENYGWINDQMFSTNFDAGLAYLLNNNLQVDFSGGYGKNDGISDFFLNAGISVRTSR